MGGRAGDRSCEIYPPACPQCSTTSFLSQLGERLPLGNWADWLVGLAFVNLEARGYPTKILVWLILLATWKSNWDVAGSQVNVEWVDSSPCPRSSIIGGCNLLVILKMGGRSGLGWAGLAVVIVPLS